MRCRIVGCVVLSGCGFQSRAMPGGDAGPNPPDAVIDAMVAADVGPDTPAMPDCWGHWLAHNPLVGSPARIVELSTGDAERDPWISSDGLRMYFDREPTTGTSDVYFTTRAAGQPFMPAMKLDNLSRSDSDEGRPALSHDERTLVLSSNQDGNFDIYIATRPDVATPFGSPNQDHLGSVNGPGGSVNHHDPFLTADGRTLYLAPDPNGTQAAQHISFTTRSGPNEDFPTPAKVPGINTADPFGDADPSLSLDELVILFSSNRQGGDGLGDMYYATRTDRGQSFGPPSRIPTVNSPADDGDPMLTGDGCDLYFSSRRTGNYELYVARVAR